MGFRKLAHNVLLIWFALIATTFISGCNQQGQNWVTYDLDFSRDKIWVRVIMSDANGNVWVAQPYENVLHIYREHQRLTFPDIGAINAISFDGKGQAWIATDSRVIVMDHQTYDVETVFPGETYDITVDSKEQAWTVTPDGVRIFDGTEWRTDELECPVRNVDYLPEGSIAIDADQRVWVIEWQCIHTYDDKGWKSSELPTSLWGSNDLVTDREGLVWFVSGTGYILTCRDRECTGLDKDLTGVCGHLNCVNTVVFDQENHLWIGTTKGAFSLKDDGEWLHFDKDNSGLEDNYVLSIAFDRRGWTWFGSRDERISILSSHEEQIALPDEVQMVELAFAVPKEAPTESEKSLLSLIKEEAADYEIEVLEASVREGGVVFADAQTGEVEQSDLLFIEYQSRGKDASDTKLVRYESGVLSQLSLLMAKKQGLTISAVSIDIYDHEGQRAAAIGMEVDKIEAFQAEEITAAEFEASWIIFPDSDYGGTLQVSVSEQIPVRPVAAPNVSLGTLSAKHWRQGNDYLVQGKYEEAIEQYRKAIEIDPDWALPHFNLGVAYYYQQQYSEAAFEFQWAIELDPSLLDDEALEAFKTVVKAGLDLDPGVISWCSGQTVSVPLSEERVPELRERLEGNPEDCQALSLLAIHDGQQGDYEAALERWQKVVEVCPVSENFMFLGEAYRRLEMEDEAIAAYTRAVELNPFIFPPRLDLGNLYFDRGSTNKAIAHYAWAYSICPITENETRLIDALGEFQGN